MAIFNSYVSVYQRVAFYIKPCKLQTLYLSPNPETL